MNKIRFFCEVFGGVLILICDNKVLMLMLCCNVILCDRVLEMVKIECNLSNFKLNISNYDFLVFFFVIILKNFFGVFCIYIVWGIMKSLGWSVVWWL